MYLEHQHHSTEGPVGGQERLARVLVAARGRAREDVRGHGRVVILKSSGSLLEMLII